MTKYALSLKQKGTKDKDKFTIIESQERKPFHMAEVSSKLENLVRLKPNFTNCEIGQSDYAGVNFKYC